MFNNNEVILKTFTLRHMVYCANCNDIKISDKSVHHPHPNSDELHS